MTKEEHDALRAQTVADMHGMARPLAMRFTHPEPRKGRTYPIALAAELALSEVRDDGEGRPYVEDIHGRRWLLDGSGDVA